MFLSSFGKLLSLLFLGGGATLAGCKTYENQCCPETTVSSVDTGSYEYRGFTDSGGQIIFGFELRPAKRPACPYAKKS